MFISCELENINPAQEREPYLRKGLDELYVSDERLLPLYSDWNSLRYLLPMEFPHEGMRAPIHSCLEIFFISSTCRSMPAPYASSCSSMGAYREEQTVPLHFLLKLRSW